MSEKVTFQELIDSIAEETDSSREFIHDFLHDFVSVINTGLEKEGKVNIAGLGKFELRHMDEREGYNPQTDEKITIPAHNKIVFKPYKDLRELVNAPYAHMKPEIIKEPDSKETEETSETGQTEQGSPPEKPDSDAPENIFDFSDLERDEDEPGFIPTAPPPSIKSESEQEESTGEKIDSDDEETGKTDSPAEEASDDRSEEGNTGERSDRDVIEYHSTPAKKETAEDEEELEKIDSFLTEHIEDARKGTMEDSGTEQPEPTSNHDQAEGEDHEQEQGVEESAPDKTTGTEATGKPDLTLEEKDETEDHQKDEEEVDKIDKDEGETAGEGITTEPDESTTEPVQSPPFNIDKSRTYGADSRTFFPSPSKKRSTSWTWGLAAVIVLLLVIFGVWYFTKPPGNNQQPESMASAQKEQSEVQNRSQEPSPADSDADDDTQTPADNQQQDPAAKTPKTNAPGGQQQDVTEQTVNRGETLWSIADDNYENPYLWPWIYDANKETIPNPNLIYAGQSLSIPVPDGPDHGLSSADSLEVAIGYVETYLWHKEQNIDNAKYYLWAATKYDKDILDHIPEPIDKEDLAFVNRVR